MRILVIDDECRAFKQALEKEGFKVDMDRGTNLSKAAQYDLIVCDLDCSKACDLTVIKGWRQSGIHSHILAVSSRSALEVKVAALDAGADCCMVKPYRLEEFLARVRALLRRRPKVDNAAIVRIFDLEIDISSRSVKRTGRSIQLTPREFDVLKYLALHAGKVVSRSMIWHSLYGSEGNLRSNVLDVHVRCLRTKIDKGFDVPLIQTVWGSGYMMRNEPVTSAARTSTHSLAV